MPGWKRSFKQPAKLAERVLAPGDGEAEPGVTATNFREPAKLATDDSRGILLIKNLDSKPFFARFICRPLCGLGRVGVRFPRLGFAVAWG
jgi:hypothetical protein